MLDYQTQSDFIVGLTRLNLPLSLGKQRKTAQESALLAASVAPHFVFRHRNLLTDGLYQARLKS